MKSHLFIAAVALLCYQFHSISTEPPPSITPKNAHRKIHMLGTKECTWGPSYWCQNLTAAGDCHATKHCIQTVWIHKQVPTDNSNVCQICLDMVKQARDQLESNETQEMIKEVFEGSCALLHVKPIVKECDKIADNYIPDLVETLASEMNPQIVCSVAGLCNNEHFKKLVKHDQNSVVKKLPNTCDGCHTVVKLLENKFNQMSRDEVLQAFLQICGRMSSLSDACSNIIITYFTEIYNHLQDNLNPTDVCLMAGECNRVFHSHADVEITPMSHVGYLPVNEKDNLPCDLCQQLVGHLRDLLVTNTTEEEFKQVLQGLCKQTKSFKEECLGLVDQYYTMAYNFLVSELNSTEVCAMAGICPRSKHLAIEGPIAPLLPIETVNKAVDNLHRINMAMDKSQVKIMQTPEQAQLPIERLMPPHAMEVIYNKEYCAFCEYFLHYLQQMLSSAPTEEEIKNAIHKLCYKLPSTVNETCVAFVDTYSDMVTALLVQEIDPANICPLLRLCPASDAKDVEVFMQVEKDNGKCPLCLFAVTRLEEMVKNNKTEANIENALDNLCSHLSKNLAQECTDFVQTYTNELIELLLADLKPQEVCVYLQLCKDNQPAPPTSISEPQIIFGGEIETNEIPDYTANGKPIHHYKRQPESDKPQCVLCEFVMSQIEHELQDNKTEQEIKKVVHNVCNLLPKTVKQDCNKFIDQYADTIIQLLIQALEPQEICSVMNLCMSKGLKMKADVLDCAICKSAVTAIDKILENPHVDHNIKHVLEKACRALPSHKRQRCTEIIETYGDILFNMMAHYADSNKVCRDIGLCLTEHETLVGANKCSWGPTFWCETKDNALLCGKGATTHCREKVWFGEEPSN